MGLFPPAMLLLAAGLYLTPQMSVTFQLLPQSIQLDLHCPSPGWCGIGFGKGMKDVDMVVVTTMKNGTAQVQDCYGVGYKRPMRDEELGGKEDWEMREVNLTIGEAKIRVKRLLKTGDPYDVVIRKAPMNISYAYSTDPGFEYHYDGAGMVEVDLASMVVAKPKLELSQWSAHGDWMLALWGIAAPALIAVARALRFHMAAMLVHAIGGTIVLGLSGYQVISAVNQSEGGRSNFHARVGTWVAGFSLFQLLTGLGALYLSYISSKPGPIRALRNAHYAFGLATTIVAIRNVYYGRRMLYKSTDLSFTLVCILVVCAVLVELFSRSKRITHCFLRRSKTIVSPNDVNRLISSGKSLCYLNQYVLDISAMELYHPGGVGPLQARKGMDIGRFIYGIGEYKHSNYAKQLCKRLTVATLRPEEGLLHGIRTDFTYQMWNCAYREGYNESLCLLGLLSMDSKLVADQLPIEQYGKHMIIKRKDGVRSYKRYYSIAFCMRNDRRRRWAQLAAHMGLISPYTLPESPPALPLLVRIYPEGKVSSWLNTLKPNDQVWLKGPFGAGLGLERDWRGQALAIAGGTGLIPFLDLIDLLWHKEAHSQGHITDFDSSPLDGLSLHLWVSFRSEADAVALSLLTSLQRLCKGPAPRFQLSLYYSDKSSRQERKRALLQALSCWGLGRVWVSGPAALCRTVEKQAQRAGLAPQLVHWV